MGVGAKCLGNAGEGQGNTWECVQSAMGMWGNARGCMAVGAKRQSNRGECREMPRERMEVGAKCQGNAEECQGNVWECKVTWEWREMQGNNGNVWVWVQSAR